MSLQRDRNVYQEPSTSLTTQEPGHDICTNVSYACITAFEFSLSPVFTVKYIYLICNCTMQYVS